MKAFLCGVALQWKLDIRSKALLITCYVVPFLFFAFMGGIFTSINPQAKDTLIQSMTVMCVTVGAMIGLPPSLVEIYASDMQKVYRANGVPNYLGVVTLFLSALIHLLIMSAIIYIVAPIAFDAAVPASLPLYMGSLAIFIAVSLSIGCVLGLLLKNQAKLTMVSQLFFLPSIMLSADGGRTLCTSFNRPPFVNVCHFRWHLLRGIVKKDGGIILESFMERALAPLFFCGKMIQLAEIWLTTDRTLG